ncbi:Ig-like domain-containing protein [Tatumella ptyseos]|uniref:Ig-like domain-containing protein n=1 Tax=Tatumella ptyseos TaxID=82987 RepID=UPI0026F20E7D|nr:Ig-like domain-containing protein [Tatumella ptyseos]WKX26976.1 Ig-like domain-containing protein [Tatumella ptyseos]
MTATDAAGNVSSAATITAADITAPTEPSGIQISDDGTILSGKGEAGSTITVKDAEGNTLGTATVGSDGTFSVTLPTAQTNGQTLSVTATCGGKCFFSSNYHRSRYHCASNTLMLLSQTLMVRLM